MDHMKQMKQKAMKVENGPREISVLITLLTHRECPRKEPR